MNFHQIKLKISAASFSQFPTEDIPHIVFAGRSNAGKSSLINKILNRKNFARTSAKPGKTATINFYELDGKAYLADLPGYGFASVSKQEQEKWGVFINDYLTTCEKIAVLFLLADIRHKPSREDKVMCEFLKSKGISFIIIATKSDKISAGKVGEQVLMIANEFQISQEYIIPFSTVTGQNVEKVKEIIEELGEAEEEKV